MAEYTGKDLVIKWGGTVISGDQRTFTVSDTAELVDATAGADARKVWLTGPTDGEASASILAGTAGTANYNALAPGQSGTLFWAPEGTAAGKQTWTALAVSTGRSMDIPYNDVVVMNPTWKLSGAVTGGTA